MQQNFIRDDILKVATKKWSMSIQNLGIVLNQFILAFGYSTKKELKLNYF